MERRLPIPRWRRRGLELKIAIVLLLVLCYVLFHSPSLSGSGDPSEAVAKSATPRTPMPPRDGSASTLKRLGVDPVLLKDDTPQPREEPKEKPARDETPVAKKSEQSTLGNQEAPRPDRKESDGSKTPSHAIGSAADIKRVGTALRNILSNVPDEGEVEDLLVSFRGTGAVKLRDVGVKARAYKKYFQLWEALHVVQDGDNAYVRGDMLRFIRDNHDELDLPDTALAQTLRSYESFRHVVTSLADLLFPWTAPYFGDHMTLHTGLYKAGKGIVLSAGQDQVPYLLATIPAMRKLGCNLPIEVMYLGDDDISEDNRELLEMLPGVITRDIKQMTKDTGWELAGWAAKPFAMLLSSFQEVMFIDADAVFFRNPASLFESPQYLANGALFFQDRSIFPESKRRWLKSILPKPISRSAQRSRLWTGESGHQQESGVVLIDKWKHFIELLLVTRMNGPDRDGNKDQGLEGIYDMVYGDKETFWLAWELLRNSHYAFHEGFRGSMGAVRYDDVDKNDKDELHKTPEDKNKGKDKPAEGTDGPSGSGDLASGKIKSDKPETLEEAYAAAHARLEAPNKDAGAPYVDPSAENTPDAIKYAPAEPGVDDPIDSTGEETPGLRKRATPKDLEHHSQTNYTICAPQLLHLDADRKPLWFNGWLARNKFKDPTQSVPATFDAWIMEPPMASKADAWKLGESNEACLTADSVTEFTKEERAVLDMIIEIAQEVKALGKKKD